MSQKKFNSAFTILELIIVIVIMGIVSSIGAGAIARVFESYIMQKAIHNASVKTELAINQLANRLAYRIDMSMLARKPGHTGLTSSDVYPASEVPLSLLDEYIILEWINYDNDGLNAASDPAWSGFCDLNNTKSTFTKLSTPGSNLNSEKSVMNYYTSTTDGTGGAVLFTGASDYKENTTAGTVGSYAAECMYTSSTSSGCIFPVSITGATDLTFSTTAGDRTSGEMIYTEFYQFVTTAFAVVPTNSHSINGVSVWDLDLHYAYQPWEGENYLNGKSNTLLRNVSVFRFRKENNSIRLKLCVIEQISESDQISICKEKAVIR